MPGASISTRLSGIREFRLRDFKSYEAAALRPSPLTLLIGPNASGKSNMIEGIRLLSWLARGKRSDEVLRAMQDEDLAVRGSLTDLVYQGGDVFTLGCSLAPEGWDTWTELSVGVCVTESGMRIVSESIESLHDPVPLYNVVESAAGFSHDVQVAYNNFARGGQKPRIACTDQQLILTQLGTPARFGKAHVRSQELIPLVTTAFRDSLSQMMFLDPAPRRMRGYSHPAERMLREDGRNLSSVLFDLCSNGHKAAVLDFIRALPEQDITDISFVQTPRNEVMVQLRESFPGAHQLCDAPVLSDGTLRVLAIAAALLSAKEGSLVLIEEIDNGVHPSRAKLLLDNIFRISKDRGLSVLLTSHNPALSDALPVDAIPHVACCFRSPTDGDSRIVHVEDIPAAAELLARGPLGKLMTKGELDRFLKNPVDPETKARAAIAWLDSLAESAQ